MNTLLKTFLIITVATYTISAQNKDKSNYDDVVFLEYSTHSPFKPNAISKTHSNQKILMQNGQVKVTEITLKPYEKENVHPQLVHNVVYIQEGKDFLVTDPNGKIIFDTRKLEKPLVYPKTLYKTPDAPYCITNLSKTLAIKLIFVETKQ